MAPAVPKNPIAGAEPTATIAELATLVSRQQATVTVVEESSDSGGSNLGGGAIAGIVLGSIFGTLLLLWIIRSCFNLGSPPGNERESWYRDVETKPHHHRHSSSRHRRSRRSSSLSAPPPVIIRDSTVPRQQPTYVYTDTHGRGRRHSRGEY
jgi:hypothetical protein